jgi:hypothetical protein
MPYLDGMSAYLRSKDSSITDPLRPPTTLWHTHPVFESSFNFVAGFLVAGP